MKIKLIGLILLIKVITSCSNYCKETDELPRKDLSAKVLFFDESSDFFFFDSVDNGRDVEISIERSQLGDHLIFSQSDNVLCRYEVISKSEAHFTIRSYYFELPSTFSWKPSVNEYLVKICTNEMILVDSKEQEFLRPVIVLNFDN